MSEDYLNARNTVLALMNQAKQPGVIQAAIERRPDQKEIIDFACDEIYSLILNQQIDWTRVFGEGIHRIGSISKGPEGISLVEFPPFGVPGGMSATFYFTPSERLGVACYSVHDRLEGVNEVPIRQIREQGKEIIYLNLFCRQMNLCLLAGYALYGNVESSKIQFKREFSRRLEHFAENFRVKQP